jgi:hypothetical protein
MPVHRTKILVANVWQLGDCPVFLVHSSGRNPGMGGWWVYYEFKNGVFLEIKVFG